MAGILTRVIDPADYLPEIRAFGNVLALDPLLDLEEQWRAAASDLKIAAAELQASRAAFRQVEELYKDSAVARIKHEQSKMAWLSALARHEQAAAKADAVRLRARQNWGETLTAWATQGNSPEFKNLIGLKSVLLSVSFRPGENLPQGIHTVFVHRSAERVNARPAELISSAPVTAEKSQGERYFFSTAAGSLRTGMHLYVWIPVPGAARRAIEIPPEALVWRDGRPWIYMKTAEESFLRHAVDNAVGYGDRWFIADELDRSAEVVVNGGQMLLSEEFHWQIPEEGDD
jgi:hypothetical protein